MSRAWTMALCAIGALTGREVQRLVRRGPIACALTAEQLARSEEAVRAALEQQERLVDESSLEAAKLLEELFGEMQSVKNLSAAFEARSDAASLQAAAVAEAVTRADARCGAEDEAVAAVGVAVSAAEAAAAEARAAAAEVREAWRAFEASASPEALSRKVDAVEAVARETRERIAASLAEAQQSIKAAHRRRLEEVERAATARADEVVREAVSRSSLCHARELDGKYVDYSELKRLVDEAARRYLEGDRLGEYDFALAAAGATVVNRLTSEPYTPDDRYIPTWLWHSIGRDAGVGRRQDAISERVSFGSCFAFAGASGNLTVKTSAPVRPTSFSLEHIHGALCNPVHNRNCSSAPRTFKVLGFPMGIGSDSGVDPPPSLTLGEYQYHANSLTKPALQNFPVDPSRYHPDHHDAPAFDYITLQVDSNHGHPNYTCIYRFRVHGLPAAAALGG
ncbi:hypothetical protein CTAYLR_003625 [Chrysophaeum taylorii]|uniref:SUN domain-containing protein n=1 Tax=Chrysophaeum taylorii TaxID=2483200 RepID=A0AAD7XI07_9STRA|nr:hypothetical protein CTAYLR_003625 [Chrysophaeum taylorii]